MTALAHERILTYREPYRDPPEDRLFEVVDGEYREKTMGVLEMWLASIMAQHLGPHCRKNGLGRIVTEVLFKMQKTGNGRKPDLAYVSFQKWPKQKAFPRTEAWNIVPDLAVEAISPSQTAIEVLEKLMEYFDNGIGKVWHIYPDAQQLHLFDSPTSVRILTIADELVDESLFPEFRLPLVELFPVFDTE